MNADRAVVLAVLGTNAAYLAESRFSVHATTYGSRLSQSEVIDASMARVPQASSGSLRTRWALDANGEARARLALPDLDSAPIGVVAHHAAVTFGDGLAAEFAKQPVPLSLVP